MDYEYETEETSYWQLQEAKAMFSEVVRSANIGPQIITVHGKESAVVLSMDEYRRLKFPKEGLVSFMERSPWADTTLKLPERKGGKMRNIDL